jgi:hypothetical protein
MFGSTVTGIPWETAIGGTTDIGPVHLMVARVGWRPVMTASAFTKVIGMVIADGAIMITVGIAIMTAILGTVIGTAIVTSNSLRQGQTRVIFGESLRSGPRAGYVLQLRDLAAVLEGAILLEAMQHVGHPPGELLHSPNTPQTGL